MAWSWAYRSPQNPPLGGKNKFAGITLTERNNISAMLHALITIFAATSATSLSSMVQYLKVDF